MKVYTTRFGELDIQEKDVITLRDGILGFPDATRFILLDHDSEGTPFKWLQALEDPNLAFIVMDPNLLVENYEVTFDAAMAEKVGNDASDEQFAMMAIVNVPHENPIEMTVNVRAPVIVDLEKRVGWQIILPNEEYGIRQRVFADSDSAEAPEDPPAEPAADTPEAE